MHAIRKSATTFCAVFVVVGLIADTLAMSPSSVGEKALADEEQGAILDTIAQINHINWVVNVIKTYDNVMMLEAESEKISYGNLDMNRIPDTEMLGRIKGTLDTLHALCKDERDMKHWRDKFMDERMRKMREYDLGTAKRVWGLFNDGILGLMTGDIGMVLQTAFDVGHGALSLQYDYDNFVHSFDQEMQERIFVFDSQKLELLHRQNKEMLDDQWRLVKKYHLNDKTTRVTDVDIQDLLTILKDGNASRIYTRLAPMKSRYKLFPEYWYYLSCAAMATGHFKEGREACDTFFNVNRGIFRKDPMAGTVALNKALMLEKDPINLPELKRCLEVVWNNNQGKNNWAQDYIAASLYNGILHNKTKAIEILEHAIACLESEMSERKRKNKNIASLAKTLGEYHAFLFRLIPDEPMPMAIRTSEFISFSDKLRYLARSKTDNVWEIIKDDIRGAALDLKHDMKVTIPASWLLNDDVPVKLKGLFFGRAMVELKEKVSDRMYTADNNLLLKFEEYDFPDGYPEPTIDMFAALLFQLVFDHPEFPVTLTFAVNGMEGKEEDCKLFLFSFSALGKTYQWQPESGLETPSYSSTATRQQRRNAFLSKYPLVPLDTSNFSCPDSWVVNGIKLLTVSSEDDISLEYRNVSGNKFRPCVRFVLMNEYGMWVCQDEDTYFDKYTRSERTVPGLFFDDHYVDYHYRYMSPNETRIFSVPKFTKAKYLLISVKAKYDLVETFKQ